MTSAISIRYRIDFGGACSLGGGKVRLLEAIDEHGSLSQAAKDLNMSYRRAWLLVDSMRKSFDLPVVDVATGGRGGGGATVTEFGKQVIDAFRKLETDLDAVGAKRMKAIGQHVTKESKSAPARAKLARPRAKRAKKA